MNYCVVAYCECSGVEVVTKPCGSRQQAARLAGMYRELGYLVDVMEFRDGRSCLADI